MSRVLTGEKREMLPGNNEKVGGSQTALRMQLHSSSIYNLLTSSRLHFDTKADSVA
jgi:hypothetical protein